MIKPFIVKAAMKAANFADISAFMILSWLHGCFGDLGPPVAYCRQTIPQVALQISLDHRTAGVVGLLRTIDRIDAHCQLANLNEQKVIDGAAAAPSAQAFHSGERDAAEQCAPARETVRDRLTTPMIGRFILVRSAQTR
jgi:hypothetical protein